MFVIYVGNKYANESVSDAYITRSANKNLAVRLCLQGIVQTGGHLERE